MYIIPDMIDLGLSKNKKWKSLTHRIVAQNIGLCNSRVNTRTKLTEVVSAINKIPKNQIKLVTVIDLASKYNVPYINLS